MRVSDEQPGQPTAPRDDAAAPAWYPHPRQPGALRYWNGVAWVEADATQGWYPDPADRRSLRFWTGRTWGEVLDDDPSAPAAVPVPEPTPDLTPEPEPTVDVEVTASARCLAGKAYLALRATNADEAPVAITLTTPFGSKKFGAVEVGANAYQSFASRATSFEAGTATVTATLGDVTTEIEVPYDAVSCG